MAAKKSAPKAAPKTLKPRATTKAELPPKVQKAPRAAKPAATADVVVEAFRPGVVTRLGIGYDAVRAINPRIVYVSIAAFGQTGPMAQRPAHDVSIQAESGLVSLNRGQDGRPTLPSMPTADLAGSLMAMAPIISPLAIFGR